MMMTAIDDDEEKKEDFGYDEGEKQGDEVEDGY